VHPAYLINDDGRDAALLKLSSPLVLSDYVSPICLTDVAVPTGTNCVATGWGETENPAESNLVLREVPLPIISQAECTASYGVWITPYTVCAGYMSGGRDTCQGDSGGPLVCDIAGSWQLHGLTSFGFGCAEPDYPGVYTRMSELIAWVTASTDSPADFYLAPGTSTGTDTGSGVAGPAGPPIGGFVPGTGAFGSVLSPPESYGSDWGSGTGAFGSALSPPESYGSDWGSGMSPMSSEFDYSSSPAFKANDGDVPVEPRFEVKMVDWAKNVEKASSEEIELSSRKRTIAELTKKGAKDSTKLLKYMQQ